VSPENLAALRVNLLAVSGAYLGFVSLFISWGGPHDILYSYLFSTWGVADGSGVHSIGWSVAAYLFAVGSLLSSYSPLASLLMACGDIQFLGTFFYLRDRVPNEVDVEIGLLIGILATVIVLISLFFPLGPGYEDTRRTKRERLLSWGVCT
jgi:hypothetical protein